MKHKWTGFRKLPPGKRRELVTKNTGWVYADDNSNFDERADVMIENAVGSFSVPLGIIPEILVNNKTYTLPLATEEPSVIAAANYGITLINRNGGFSAAASPSVMIEQLFFKEASREDCTKAELLITDLPDLLKNELAGMEKRGGGYEKADVSYLSETGILKMNLYINVCDALGANILNTVGEKAGIFFEQKLGLKRLMSILSNSAEQRLTKASFRLSAAILARNGKTGAEVASDIVLASRLANNDPERAVTHNKGIMNGISAFALATGNDTRALESAVHYHAGITGKYLSLTNYHIHEEMLYGEISIPLALAVKGGVTEFHPLAEQNITLCGAADAGEFAMLAASLGLGQNFAALFALVSEGIQKGHMSLHARKTAYLQGLSSAGEAE